MTNQQIETTDSLRSFDLSASDCPSTAVVMAVAEQANVDPTEIEPLQTVIDTDAMNDLFRPSRSVPSRSGTLQFEYLGYEVVLDAHKGEGYLYNRLDNSLAGVSSEQGISTEVD